MAVGATVGRAILSVVTHIVATKTLSLRSGGRFQIEAGEYLSRGGDNSVSGSGSLRIGGTKKGVFFREAGLRDKSSGGRRRSG